MKRLLAVAVVALVAACGPDKGEPFRESFPHSSTVKLNVPGASQALTSTGTRRDGLEGQTATFYQFTRGVTLTVNGGGGAVLGLVEKIVSYPPTSVTGDTAVWGPHTEALSPNTWKFTVHKTGTNSGEYTFEGKGKSEPDSAFRVVLSGSHVSTGTHLGNGSFLVDWDKAQTLPEHGAEVGTGMFTYSRNSSGDVTHVDAVFTNVKDDATGQLVNATYKYVENPGAGGSLDFSINKDFVAGPGIETLTIRSRWMQDGSGRSDVHGTGGDLATQASANECWDSGFASRYFQVSFAPAQDYGLETVCAFATAEYSSL